MSEAQLEKSQLVHTQAYKVRCRPGASNQEWEFWCSNFIVQFVQQLLIQQCVGGSFQVFVCLNMIDSTVQRPKWINHKLQSTTNLGGQLTTMVEQMQQIGCHQGHIESISPWCHLWIWSHIHVGLHVHPVVQTIYYCVYYAVLAILQSHSASPVNIHLHGTTSLSYIRFWT